MKTDVNSFFHFLIYSEYFLWLITIKKLIIIFLKTRHFNLETIWQNVIFIFIDAQYILLTLDQLGNMFIVEETSEEC